MPYEASSSPYSGSKRHCATASSTSSPSLFFLLSLLLSEEDEECSLQHLSEKQNSVYTADIHADVGMSPGYSLYMCGVYVPG